MTPRRVLLAAMAAAPAAVSAAAGPATSAGLGFALVATSVVVVFAVRDIAGSRPPAGARAWIDLGAWWAAAVALVSSVLLSSPEPSFFASGTPGRRAALAVLACVAAASVLVALGRPRASGS